MAAVCRFKKTGVRTDRAAGILRLLFTRIQTDDPRRARLLGIVQGITTNLGGRIVGILVSFLSVPLTIGYLGPERYGAWIALGSLLSWVGLTDFGLGNGVMNAVAAAVGNERPDLVRTHVTNAMVLLSGFALATGLVMGLAWPHIDWSGLFGLSSRQARAEIGPAVGVALVFCLCQIPLTVTSKLYLAYREGRIENYWGMATNLLSLLGLLAVTHTHGGLVWLVVAVSGASMAVNVVSTGWLFVWHKPILRPRFDALRLSAMSPLLDAGCKFFLIQIMALLTFQTDNIVVSHFIGAAHVPEYSLTYRVLDYAILPQSLLFSYLWSAYSEAIARGDIAWVRRTFRLSLVAGMGFTAIAALGLAIVAKPFIGWWAEGGVEPGYALIAWMAAWCLINAFTNPIACLLAAASHLGAQMIYSALATCLNIFLSIYLARRWGVEGVIAGTVIAYMVFVCLPIYLDGRYLLQRLEKAA